MGKFVHCDGVDLEIGYEEFPDRKKPMVVVKEGNEYYCLGSFSKKSNAEYFVNKLLEFTSMIQRKVDKK